MRSAIFLLIVSMLALGGCFDQSLESEQKNIASEKRVRIILGSGSSSRLNRFKGSYWDVVNGGSVKLSYSTEGGAVQTIGMTYNGSDWAADLTLSVGTYDFRASAYNNAGVMIFDTANTKTHMISSETSSLVLGIQLNPVMEDTGATPTPVITQITKPAGYLPNNELNLEFTVRGGVGDNLRFEINVWDNASNFAAGHQLHSTKFNDVTNNGASKVYNGTMGVQIPSWLTGQARVEFSVYSETLQTTTIAQFILAGAVDMVDSGNVVFMPQADFSIGVRENTAVNTIVYVMNISGGTGFTDNITFSYDDSSVTSAFALNSDSDPFLVNMKPDDPYVSPVYPYTSEQLMSDRRSGELYREFMESGTMTITFTSASGDFSIAYNFEVPDGATTQFNTVNNIESGYETPEITNVSLVSDTVALGEKLSIKLETNTLSGSGHVNVYARVFAENEHYNDGTNSGYINVSRQFDAGGDNSTTHLKIERWQAPGQWFIESFNVIDKLGSNSSYRYRPNISTSNYVRESSDYNPYNNTWNWVQEESTLPVIVFNVTGNYNPDLSSPEITSMNLTPITISLGETLAINIDVSDDSSGVCRAYIQTQTSNDNYTDPPYKYNSKNISKEIWIGSPDNETVSNFYDPYYLYYPYDPYYPYYPYYPYNNFCNDDSDSSDNGTVTITPQLVVEKWHVPGEWVIKEFTINDRAGRSSRYYQSSNQTHYSRSHRKYEYDNSTGYYQSHYRDESTNLPVLKFTATGQHTPDLLDPKITNISLASDTVALGDDLTIYVEASDDASGVGRIRVEANTEYQYMGPNMYNNNWNWGEVRFDTPNEGTVTLDAKLSFGSSLLNSNYSYSTGEWTIQNLSVYDRAGRYNNYRYRSDVSETHYVVEDYRYDNLTGNWFWAKEETALPILRFTLTAGGATPTQTDNHTDNTTASNN